MATIEASGGDLMPAAGSPIVRQGRRRDEFEAVGLLFGIFGVLLILAVTMGAGARF